MNKTDFLEILRDYLKNDFNDYEINDILRDYEEFFLNGELEGKSESEIIQVLGSPKNIAEELISEMKSKSSNSKGEKDKFNFDNISVKIKSMYKKAKLKCENLLDSNDIVKGSTPIWLIVLIILFIASIIVPFIFALTLIVISVGLGIIVFTILGLVSWIFTSYSLVVNREIGIFFTFICIAGTGALIAAWTIYINLVKIIKILILKAVSWFKTRFMYLKVKDKKKNLNNKKNGFRETMNTEEIVLDDMEVRENE